MAEFKCKSFDVGGIATASVQIEEWLNGLKAGGYFVKVEAITHTKYDIHIVALRWLPRPAGAPAAVAGDVSQPEPWNEPVIQVGEKAV